jgi:flagellin
MAQVINTNIMSLNAQRQLGKSQLAQTEAMERLSSGLRINSAKDDAAGLAISTGMQSQIRGINQAVRNSNDGISMSQTAEGSMDEMTNILQRMRELAVQAANDTNSAANKASIQEEVDQLYDELDRIANTTQFNGLNLLDGSNGPTTLQIGANSGETLSFSVDSVTTASLGLDGGVNKGDLNSGRVTADALAAGAVSVNGVDISAVAAGDGAFWMERAINIETPLTGVVADAYNVVKGASIDANGVSLTGITNGLQFAVGANDPITLGATSSMENLAETINRDVPGLNATVGDHGGLILNNDTGLAITVSGANVADAGLTATTYQGYLGLTSQDDKPIQIGAGSKGVDNDTKILGFLKTNGAAVSGEVVSPEAINKYDLLTINGIALELSSTDTAADKIFAINRLTEYTGVTASASDVEGAILFTNGSGGDIVIASDAATEEQKTAALAKLGVIDIGGSTVDELGLGVATSKTAVRSLGKIDSALQQISATRASLGAIQNRLGSTIANLENVSQNLSASNSRIQDADFAAETSKLSKTQILQQAGSSMLTQANASTQNILALLQG